MSNGLKTAGVIGWPVAHSKSPLIHRFWLEKQGIDGDYSRFAIAPAHLAAAVRAFPAIGLAGVNVTVPHKVAIMPLLDGISELATKVGAVNVVTVEDGRLLGGNSDVDGVLAAVPEAVLPAGGRVCLIGSGGAARAALAAFSQRQVAEVRLLVRDQGKGVALLHAFGLAGTVWPLADAAAATTGVQAIVNATTLGMHGAAAMPAAVLAAVGGSTAAVMDMVYAPLETALLAAARRHGLPAIDGLSMLIGQAASAFAQFYGQPPPRRHDDELRQRLLA